MDQIETDYNKLKGIQEVNKNLYGTKLKIKPSLHSINSNSKLPRMSCLN